MMYIWTIKFLFIHTRSDLMRGYATFFMFTDVQIANVAQLTFWSQAEKKMRRKWKWETSSLLQENSIGTYLYMSSVFFSLLLIVSLENPKRNIRAKNRTVSRESKMMRLHCLIGTTSPPTVLKVQKFLWTFLNNLIMRAKHLCSKESHWFLEDPTVLFELFESVLFVGSYTYE